jgi:hypothetical protein
MVRWPRIFDLGAWLAEDFEADFKEDLEAALADILESEVVWRLWLDAAAGIAAVKAISENRMSELNRIVLKDLILLERSGNRFGFLTVGQGYTPDLRGCNTNRGFPAGDPFVDFTFWPVPTRVPGAKAHGKTVFFVGLKPRANPKGTKRTVRPCLTG